MKTIKTILASVMVLATVGLFAQKMEIDVEKSIVKWHGEKVTGEHFGTVNVKEGSLNLKSNKITDGLMIIDMTSIANTDLEDEGYKAKLEGHLKSDDFFGVEKYPTARLEVKSSSAFKNNKATVKGNLTIKETTLPVEFSVQKEGNWFMAEIVIDRSKYDVRYGSGSFFDDLGDKTIYDDFTLTVKLATMDSKTSSM